jgi:hypothetical protein
MGGILMCIEVMLIAVGSVIYFEWRDRKEIKK